MWKTETGIMLALDVRDRQSAFDLLDQVIPYIDAIKFNYPLVLEEGISIIRDVKSRYAKPVLADFKVADVPVTNDRIIKIVEKSGADGIMVHGFVGIDALLSMKNHADHLKIFVVTQLTNPGGLDFTSVFTEKFAEIARTLGLAGVQAPGNRPEVVRQVRSIVGKDLMIVCCGVGAQGGKYGAAINAGADFEIIGRAIYDSPDPVRKVLEINEAIRQARTI